MTPIEILALLFGIAAILKMIGFFFTPKYVKNFSRTLFGWTEKNSTLTMLIAIIAAAVIGYYLLQTFTIVQIAAVMMFAVVLIGATLIPFSKDFDKLTSRMLSKEGIKKMWILLIIWLGLAIWVLYALFA